MDTLATIVFARIILKSIQNKNNLSKKDEFSLLKSSIIATIGLAIVYLGLAYLGANIGNYTHLSAGAEKLNCLLKLS